MSMKQKPTSWNECEYSLSVGEVCRIWLLRNGVLGTVQIISSNFCRALQQNSQPALRVQCLLTRRI